MNASYETFYNDLNNVIEYKNHRYCFDHMIYTFKDKYRLMNKDTLSQYYNGYINMNKNKVDVVKLVHYIMDNDSII